jgi:peptidoglycan/xylan/chitin deacetylase (PgdA/CDA1 family)
MPVLRVISYHYVRDLAATAFPRLRGMLTDDFRSQVSELREVYETATLDAALAFLRGEYHPSRDLCLLTFDDGLKDHYTDVMPILVDWRIAGLFFVITGCLEEQRVAPVHKSHFLMASIGSSGYRDEFLVQLEEEGIEPPRVDVAEAQLAYPLDAEEVALFKYMINFVLSFNIRDRILSKLFVQHFGDETAFAKKLYLSWTEAREIQEAGACIGGHSHAHMALATLNLDQQRSDLDRCHQLLRARLRPQASWPFCFPFGGPSSFSSSTVELVREMGFSCAFTTIHGVNCAGENGFGLKRIDTVRVTL